jgi:putative SOS response-associated peptidase YedK
VKTTTSANEIRFRTFNARAESINKKPAFSFSFSSKRCIIPVIGFFEWQHIGPKKIPWYIYHTDNEILSFAGLWDEWVDTSSGELLSTFSIVTTSANELMAGIHNSARRMPVILDQQSEKQWIDLDSDKSIVLQLLKPCPSEILKAYTIGKLINDKNANRNRPELIKHYSWGSENTLF